MVAPGMPSDELKICQAICRQFQAAARNHYQYVTNVPDSDQLDPQLRFNISLASRALVQLSDPADAQPLAERSVEILKQISAEFPRKLGLSKRARQNRSGAGNPISG